MDFSELQKLQEELDQKDKASKTAKPQASKIESPQTEEPEEKSQSVLAPKHQVTKAPELQSAKALSHRPAIDIKQESTKAGSNHSAKAPLPQAIKHLKHFSSYLTPESWKRIKMLATEREQHDYEILQDAIDLYFANLDKTEK